MSGGNFFSLHSFWSGLNRLATAAAEAIANRPAVIWAIGAFSFLALGVTPLITELVLVNNSTIDFTYPLDTTIRWQYGHWPHIDYHTPVGFSYWLIQGIAIELFGPSARILFWANLIAAIAVGGAGYYLLRYRLSGGLVAVFITGIVVIIFSPRSFGDSWGLISYLAPYNKIGVSILSVLWAVVLVEAQTDRSRRQQNLEILIVVVLMLWLVYLKLNFAIIAIAAGAVGFVVAPKNRLLLCASGALSFGAATWVTFGTTFGEAYLADVRSIAKASELIRWQKLFDDLAFNSYLIGVSIAVIAAYRLSSGADTFTKNTNAGISIGLILGGFVTMNQAHGIGMPFFLVAIVVLAARAMHDRDDHRPVRTTAYGSPTILAAILVFVSIYQDARSMQVFVSQQVNDKFIRFCEASDMPACAIAFSYFDAHELSILTPFPAPGTETSVPSIAQIEEFADAAKSTTKHVKICNSNPMCVSWSVYDELYTLLNATMTRNDRPLLLGFMNILPFYYQVEPPKNVMAWYDLGRTFSPEYHLDGGEMFSDVTLVVVPRTKWAPDFVDQLFSIYEADLEEKFYRLIETDSWSIWRRKDSTQGQLKPSDYYPVDMD